MLTRDHLVSPARFRIKKKQWTLNLERSITELSGRVEELEREAAELRRENGWLKEIVMLKSKRFGGQAPVLDPNASGGGSADDASPKDPGSADEGSSGENEKDDETTPPGKGKEVQR